MKTTTGKQILILLLVILMRLNMFSQISVSVDTNTRFQQIQGWGVPLTMQTKQGCGPTFDIQMKMWVNDMGCNSFRWEYERRNWEDYKNDNSNPDSIDWNAFITKETDQKAIDVVLPMKALVKAKGEKLWLYESESFFRNGSSGDIPLWLLESPAELSEFEIAHLKYVKNKYGITIDQLCVVNEPENGNAFTSGIVGKMIRYIGPELQKAGLSTTIMFPEHARTDSALGYIKRWQNDPSVMDYISCFSNHLYFGTELMSSEKSSIYAIAKAKNKYTAQTEYMGPTFDIFYDDLVNGGNSFWYLYMDRDYINYNTSKTSFNFQNTYWDMRQVLHYVKQGSFRVSATSSSPSNTKVMAFTRNGRQVVVCQNTTGASSDFVISGLNPGKYAVNIGNTEAGIKTVDASGIATVTIGNNKIATLYATGGLNQPPLIKGWSAAINYMTLPTSSTNLTVTVDDQEKEAITYKWTVKTQPAGASVTITNSTSSTSTASNLSVAGDYFFTVAVSDGTNTINQEVLVRVVPSNQPPAILDVHYRIPVFLQLPGGTKTTLRGAARDQEGNTLTYTWSIVSQPAGASAALSAPNATSCDATNMTVAGDYVFRFTTTDGTSTVYKDITVPVHPANHNPVIGTITATPSAVTLPSTTCALSASVTDADNDAPGFWWTVKTKPAGANPVFDRPGYFKTNVSGLSIAGTYVFTLTAADNFAKATKDVTVTVSGTSTNYTLTVTSGTGSGSYAAGTIVNISANTAPAGKVFDTWTGNTTGIANVNASSITITMPASNASITATYKDITYSLTVTSGSGSGSYASGTVVNITANAAPSGKVFDKWTGNTSGIANVNSASTTITMPASAASITATYKDIVYTLTVSSGTGGGTYASGTVVPIAANTAPAGQMFDKWTGNTTGIADVNAASTTITMPAGDASITATYKAIPPTSFTLTVNSGTGSGTYLAATVVNIAANAAPTGKVFDKWTGNTSGIANINSANTTISMPAANTTITATYKDITYTLTVTSGTGSGSYAAGTVVSITASTDPTGKVFDKWTGNTTGIANLNSAGTTITMPAANTTITATYKDVTYTLTVNSGTGSGSYVAGSVVQIKANAAPTGKVFDKWTGSVSGVNDVYSETTTFNMTSANAVLTATYKDAAGLESIENLITIYPNPVAQYFSIKSNIEIVQVRIYSSNGILVHEIMDYVCGTSIDIGNTKGIYLVVVMTVDGSLVTKRIFVE